MPQKGLSHILAALGYSMAGARFLLKEEAARIELIALALALLVLTVLGAGALQLIGLIALAVMVFMVEAINTSIELIVDRTSPERSDYAKHAKDLGSLAVMCSLTIAALYVLVVLIDLIWR